jgi:hypothetical protein
MSPVCRLADWQPLLAVNPRRCRLTVRHALEPGDDVLLTGAEAVGSIERGALGVVGFPVEVGAGSEEALGGAARPSRRARSRATTPGALGLLDRLEELLAANPVFSQSAADTHLDYPPVVPTAVPHEAQ